MIFISLSMIMDWFKLVQGLLLLTIFVLTTLILLIEVRMSRTDLNQGHFGRAPQVGAPRSSFSRSHSHKTTFNSGDLIPIFVDEVLPGDTIKLKLKIFARLATPIRPVMDPLFMDSFFFFTPMRLLWKNWERMNGARDNPKDSIDFTIPQMVSPSNGGYAGGSLSDYMGIPTAVPDLSHSSLFHRNYNLVWNEWFRSQDLQDSLVVDQDDGPDDHNDYPIQKRGKRYDYFTSCLPSPQKGSTVDIPLTGDAPVTGIGGRNNLNRNSWETGVGLWNAGQFVKYPRVSTVSGATTSAALNYAMTPTYNNPDSFTPDVKVDLSNVSAITINELRTAFQLQRLLEKDARGGTRYVEFLKSHFGVISPDYRLQRPEYLGGSADSVTFHTVAQTEATNATTPQANVSAFGVINGNPRGFVKSFTEHGIVMGLVSARALLSYQQGLSRKFSRKTRVDHYLPVLAHLGEQKVLNKEIFAEGSKSGSDDDGVFGYQERWAEYRYFPNLITGLFRSNASGTLDSWHLSEKFTTLPKLSAAFIQSNPPVKRVIAVPTEPDFLFDCFIESTYTRVMPLYSVPGMTDRF
ncbi:MAG: major capsid protein [Microviridae sp.]|nr:MAG: major capsid protein [Microviridae sp.]